MREEGIMREREADHHRPDSHLGLAQLRDETKE